MRKSLAGPAPWASLPAATACVRQVEFPDYVSAGAGAGGLGYGLVPGDPDASIIVFRMLHNEAQIKMPELSRSVVHEEGVALVSDWIETLPGSCP